MVIQLGGGFEVGVDHLSNGGCTVCRLAVVRDVSFLGGGLIMWVLDTGRGRAYPGISGAGPFCPLFGVVQGGDRIE